VSGRRTQRHSRWGRDLALDEVEDLRDLLVLELDGWRKEVVEAVEYDEDLALALGFRHEANRRCREIGGSRSGASGSERRRCTRADRRTP